MLPVGVIGPHRLSINTQSSLSLIRINAHVGWLLRLRGPAWCYTERHVYSLTGVVRRCSLTGEQWARMDVLSEYCYIPLQNHVLRNFLLTAFKLSYYKLIICALRNHVSCTGGKISARIILIIYFPTVVPLTSCVFFPVGLSLLTRQFQQVLCSFGLLVWAVDSWKCRVNDERPTGKNTQLLNGTTMKNR